MSALCYIDQQGVIIMIQMLRADDILDTETGVHYAFIRTFRDISGLHRHDFYEFFLVTRGRVWHIANDRRELLEAGALVLMRPPDAHRYERFEAEDCELINLAFTAATFEAVVAFLGMAPSGLLDSLTPPVRRLSPVEAEFARDRLQAVGRRQGQAMRAEARAVVADLFVRHFVSPPDPVRAPLPAWLVQLMGEMQQRENFVAGLPRLYELCPTSKEHLCRTMQRHLGQTPTEWVNGLRLQYAADLLAGTDDAVVAVSMQAGFENLSHFYHLFRREFGLAPARYREVHRRIVVPT
jgi:AraC family transcriptional regulator, dual regulator of chb operon